MTPIDYLKSLIAGMEMGSEIPVQLSELKLLIALLEQENSAIVKPKVPQYTTGHCRENNKPGGCQLHNLQCGYPECDREAIE